MNIASTNIDNVLHQLALGPDLVVPLVQEVPRAILKRRPSPGVWSAHEHACHLAAVQPMMLERLEYILSDDSPVITPYEPASDDPDDALLIVDLDEALERFRQERHAMVNRLRQLQPEQWAMTAEHGEYSHYSVFIMFRHLALHDLYHAYRIEQRLLNKEWAGEH
ncbi:MAG: DinB family protein [Proteobacteria bacterium]|nr:DinB family protein [Pseudomonadota bacterium]